MTLIVAVSDRCGLLYHEIHTQSVTKDIFYHFLTSLKTVLADEDAVILMDNALCHREADTSIPDLRVKFLPPYSPFLNPTENCFSVLKCRLKQHLNTFAGTCNAQAARRASTTLRVFREQHLISRLEESLIVITPEVVQNNYTFSNRYLMKCIARDDIWE